MYTYSMTRAGMVAVLGIVSLLPLTGESQASPGAADRESYYYRQKPWSPVELSGRITDIKQVPVNGLDARIKHIVVKIRPDRSSRNRSYGYERIVDLGESARIPEINRGDHIMVWGKTRRINEMPVIFADSFQINDGVAIEAKRDPAFRKGYVWGRPLRDADAYEFENVDIDNPDKWYFDSYEYVGYPYRELPPGASAPWARNEREFQQRRAERHHEDERYARHDQRDADRADRRASPEAAKADQQLKRDVESELTWSPFVDADKVNVSVRNGIVTLSGKVEDEDEVQAAIDNAYEAGARRVISKLTTEE
ncbi:MAG TPA: BON domain-containing protein [Nitrospira sp.]|nr:BON domain-containing protein [Nitrospira sp.]